MFEHVGSRDRGKPVYVAFQQLAVIAVADLMDACHMGKGYLFWADIDAGRVVAVIEKATD